jgi:hypothetical protein
LTHPGDVVADGELLEEEGNHPERYVILDKAKGLIVSNGATIEEQYDWAETEQDV